MTAILAHFRSLECRHRHKSRNCDEAQIAMQCGKEICIAARLERSACVRYPTGKTIQAIIAWKAARNARTKFRSLTSCKRTNSVMR